jgi:hypothetical protein
MAEKSNLRAVGVFVIAWVVIALAINACAWVEGTIDDFGWIRHSHDTPVWIGGDWLTGEYRACKMPLMPNHSLPASAHLICGQDFKEDLDDPWPQDFVGSIPNHDLYELMGSKWDAAEHYFHVLPVMYWGRIDRNSQMTFSWRCQKETSGLTCYALN